MKKNNFWLKWAFVGLVLLAVTGITLALPKSKSPLQQDRKITITLLEQDWNIVIQALSEMPLKVSGGVYSSIMTQAQSQLVPQQKPKDTTKPKKQ